MDRQQVAAWVTGYERAWRAPDSAGLAEIFTPDATYQQAPYEQLVVGLPAIARMWTDESDGPDEVFRLTTEIVAVDGDTGVIRAEVWYGEPVRQEYRDLWIVRFAPDGRCQAFEEWPFWPGQPYAAQAGAG